MLLPSCCTYRAVFATFVTHRHAPARFTPQDEIKKIQDAGGVAPALPIDDDLPGRGQFYCLSCARHFINDDVLQYHYRTKQHKKRLKAVMEKPYTHAEAEAGAGMAPTEK